MRSLTGTSHLVRLALRRDRLRLTVWVLALAVSSVLTATSFGSLYTTEQNRQEIAATMDSPAGLTMSGPAEYLEDYHYGAMMGHQMLGFTALMAGIMSVLIVVRHTRTEEETGQAELVRSNVVGRHAHLTAGLATAALANLALAVALAVGLGSLGIEGITWGGSWLYGFAHAAAGLVFAGFAAVTVQFTEHPRAASGLAMGAIGLSYVLRAMGDIGAEALSWLSPIGWVQRTFVYVDNRWWPLLIAAVAAGGLSWLGFRLSTRRDVGAGLRPPRSGTATASPALVRPLGLAFRLHRGLLIGFSFAAFLLGASYGSILGDAEEMLGGIEMMEEVLSGLGGATLAESFASLVMMVMAIIISIYVVMAAFKARSEESSGRAEPVLATALSRGRWLGSHVVVALVGGSLVMAFAGLGIGIAGASSTGDNGLVGSLLGGSLAYIPALWVTAGVAVALFGLIPRLALAAWVVPLYGFIVGYLGELLQFPAWMSNLTPFGHVPQIPAATMEWTPLVVLTAVAAGLLTAGAVGFRRRDLQSTT